MSNGSTPTVYVVSGPAAAGATPTPTLANAITSASSAASSASVSATAAAGSASAAATSAAAAAAAQTAVEALENTVIADLNVAQADITQLQNQISLINQTAQTLIGDLGAAESAAGAAQTAATTATNAASSASTSASAAAGSASAASASASNAAIFAAAAATGIVSNGRAPVQWATATALPTNTYSNGTLGVGATLTATANAALTIDGNSPAAGDRVLVTQEATASHNGIYVVTATGSGSAPYVLTRATDANQAASVSTAWQGWNLRQLIPSSSLIAFGSTVVVKLSVAATTSGGNLDSLYIGEQASTGNPYNFDGNQKQVTFSGSGSLSLGSGGGSFVSDPITFTFTSGKNLILAAHFSGTEVDAPQLIISGFTTYASQSATNEAALTSPVLTYTTTASQLVFFSEVDVVTANNNIPAFTESFLASLYRGIYTFCEGGTVNTGEGFVLTTSGAITVGTTGLTFTPLIASGSGLTRSGSTISIANYGTGTALDGIAGFGSNGFVERTGAGTYAFIANPLPVANGGTAASAAGGQALDNISGFSSNGFLERTGAATYTIIADPLPVAHGGTNATSAGGAALDNISGFSSNGFLERTAAATYAIIADPLPVAHGGTAVATASGTALDNITGFSSTGVIKRTGAGAYSFLSDVLESGVTATITIGYTITPHSIGTFSGTFTPSAASGNYQYGTNNGAFTLNPPAADCAIDILVTNGALAGTITFGSGWTNGANNNSALTTTSGSKFIMSIRRINGISTCVTTALQ